MGHLHQLTTMGEEKKQSQPTHVKLPRAPRVLHGVQQNMILLILLVVIMPPLETRVVLMAR
jgi:hypothetical protein